MGELFIDISMHTIHTEDKMRVANQISLKPVLLVYFLLNADEVQRGRRKDLLIRSVSPSFSLILIS